MSEDELERLRLRRDVGELLDELDIRSPAIRTVMLGEDAERALRILSLASSAPGIRNRAAFAIARWRERERRAPTVLEVNEELEELEPPTLDALELQWSQEPSFVGELLLKLMGAAIARAGGFRELKASFDERRLA